MESSNSRSRNTGLNRLSAVFIRQARTPGIHLDGGGLRFQVTRSGGRRWFMRATINGKARDIALGRAELVSMAEAREMAASIRKAIASGLEPSLAMKASRRRDGTKPSGAPNQPTFRNAWDVFWGLKAVQVASEKDRQLWINMMERYALAFIGDRPVADVRAREIIEMLRPIWTSKEETARKVLQRVDAVFTSAITREWRERASPCIGVAKELGTRRASSSHFAAMPYPEVPEFVRELRGRQGLASSRLCLEFLILTAVRSGEARGARWCEIDLRDGTWVIPRERMKMKVEHVVPLCDRAIEILVEARAASSDMELVFPGTKGQQLSDMTLLKRLRDMGLDGKATVHGFRSSFKDWCADTGVRDEVSEAALAHADRNAVRAAYRRTNYLEERRELMRRWGRHCVGQSV
jgi:integrase